MIFARAAVNALIALLMMFIICVLFSSSFQRTPLFSKGFVFTLVDYLGQCELKH